MEAVLPILLIITSSFLIISTFNNVRLKRENERLKEKHVDLRENYQRILDKYQKELLNCYVGNCYLKRGLENAQRGQESEVGTRNINEL